LIRHFSRKGLIFHQLILWATPVVSLKQSERHEKFQRYMPSAKGFEERQLKITQTGTELRNHIAHESGADAMLPNERFGHSA